jgi:hypothetical protein
MLKIAIYAPRSNWLNSVFTLLLFGLSSVFGIHTIAFSRCIGMCNGLEAFITFFLILPIWLVFGLVCYRDSRNRNIWFALYYFTLGFVCFFTSGILWPVKNYTLFGGWDFTPELITIIFGIGVLIYPLFLIWKQ